MNRSTTAVRIVVIDSHTLFAECLCLSLCQRGHRAISLAPPAWAPSVAAMLAPVMRERPDVVILSIARSLGVDGISLVHPLAVSGVQVVAVTEDIDRARWGQALSLGARAVVPNDAPLSSLAAAVRRLREGTCAMDPEERRALLALYQAQHTHQGEQRELLEKLSQRESEILSHLIFGQAVREIARLSFNSEATVRTQVKSVLAKLEVSSQLAAVALARNTGWIPRDIARIQGHLPITARTASVAS